MSLSENVLSVSHLNGTYCCILQGKLAFGKKVLKRDFWVQPHALLRITLRNCHFHFISQKSLFLLIFGTLLFEWHQTTNGRMIKKYCVSQLKQSYIYVFKALPQDLTIQICWTLNSKQHENSLSLPLLYIPSCPANEQSVILSSWRYEGRKGQNEMGEYFTSFV